MRYYISVLIKMGAAAVLFALLIVCATLIFNQMYLFNPVALPAALTSEMNYTYDRFRKPVYMDVACFEKNGNESTLLPSNQTKNDEFAREWTGLCLRVVQEGASVPANSVSASDGGGAYYRLDLMTKNEAVLQMWLARQGDTVELDGRYYTIRPELKDEILQYISASFPVKKT